MKQQPNAITVAMMRDPQGNSWQGQIQMEYKNSKDKDVFSTQGPSPMHIIRRAGEAIENKLKVIDGVTVKE
jgi:hypothetical protein